MEKISGIVRGNARVSNADAKSVAPSRTGMPTFGRPPGESTPATTKSTSTAARAVALHNGITEAKKAMSQERVISQMADEFFMTKVRAPEVPLENQLPNPVSLEPAASELPSPSTEPAPADYTPRGSYLDVRA